MDVVLRGDDLDLVSREAGITAAMVSAWREQFVASGQVGLKSRASDGRDASINNGEFPINLLQVGFTVSTEPNNWSGLRNRWGNPYSSGVWAGRPSFMTSSPVPEDLLLTGVALWGTGIDLHSAVTSPYEMPSAPHRVSSVPALALLGSAPP